MAYITLLIINVILIIIIPVAYQLFRTCQKYILYKFWGKSSQMTTIIKCLNCIFVKAERLYSYVSNETYGVSRHLSKETYAVYCQLMQRFFMDIEENKEYLIEGEMKGLETEFTTDISDEKIFKNTLNMVTLFFIACKYEEIYPLSSEMVLTVLNQIQNVKKVEKKELLDTELVLLGMLDFQIEILSETNDECNDELGIYWQFQHYYKFRNDAYLEETNIVAHETELDSDKENVPLVYSTPNKQPQPIIPSESKIEREILGNLKESIKAKKKVSKINVKKAGEEGRKGKSKNKK